MNLQEKRIVLASGSPRRRELLEQIGIQFEVITSHAEEIITKTEPDEIVQELSMLKAKAVEQKMKKNDIIDENTVIIAADTIVYHNGVVLGKPEDENDAFNMIKNISGKCHSVYTGVTIIECDNSISFSQKTDVYVSEMTDEEIHDYIAAGESMDKAGAYGIQGKFAAFIEKIDGDYYNVVGLPIQKVYKTLTQL